MQVNQQFSEVAQSGTIGIRHRFGRTGSLPTAHSSVIADGGSRHLPATDVSSPPDDNPVTPRFAAPGLVLMAVLAIFTGYHWLHLFPNGSFRPVAVLFAIVAMPATFALTRHLIAPQVPGPRFVARVSATIGLILGLVVLVDGDSSLRWVLGVTSLVLAVALVSLAFASERRRLPPAHHN